MDVRSALACDRAHHLMNRLIALDDGEFGHRDRTDRADTTHVMADQIDDHQRLGEILRAACEFGLQCRIFLGRPATADRALDRA